MILTSGVKHCTIAETDAGSLVLYNYPQSGEWLSCLSVIHKNARALLALNYGDEAIGRAPFLLDGQASDRHCLQLGKAEFRFTHPNPIGSKPGHLQLGSLGAAILGRIHDYPNQSPTHHAWLILTGESASIEDSALRPSAWEVGIMNSAVEFEALLTFRNGQFTSANQVSNPPPAAS